MQQRLFWLLQLDHTLWIHSKMGTCSLLLGLGEQSQCLLQKLLGFMDMEECLEPSYQEPKLCLRYL